MFLFYKFLVCDFVYILCMLYIMCILYIICLFHIYEHIDVCMTSI